MRVFRLPYNHAKQQRYARARTHNRVFFTHELDTIEFHKNIPKKRQFSVLFRFEKQLMLRVSNDTEAETKHRAKKNNRKKAT